MPESVVTRACQFPIERRLSTVRLSEAGRHSLFKEFVALNSPDDDLEKYLSQALLLTGRYSLQVVRRIRDFSCDPHHPGILLVQGLPSDPFLPDTPADGSRSPDKRTFVSEAVLLTLSLLLGEPFAYLAEKNGEIVHNIVPVKGSERKRSNEGSEVDFQYHTELAYFPFRPDYLLLYCLRSDPCREAGTLAADIRTACGYLSAADIVELRRPAFCIRAPQSFVGAIGELWSEPRPILTGPDDLPEACANLNGMQAITTSAQTALETFRATLQRSEVTQRVCLQPGECLLIDNRKALHGRGAFTPRYNGEDRWLQRVYVTTSLWSGRASYKGRERLF